MERFSITIVYPTLLLAFIRISHSAFSGEECLQTHNSFRSLHANTALLKYSTDLEKESQKFADELAMDDSSLPVPTRDLPKRKRRNVGPTTDPFFHKELWDGEILFPKSSRDLNKGKAVKIGESIHKFCCYSFPLCPSEFFHNLNFPPSAKGVVGHLYKEVANYDFAKGGKKSGIMDDQQTRHFTNIVWRRTTEVGCAQSKRNIKGCVYTVIRYRVEGSVGTEEDFKTNVHAIGPDDEKRISPQSNNSTMIVIFAVVVVVIIFVLIAGVVAFLKRGKIRSYYEEYKIKRGTKRAEASLRGDHDQETGFRRSSIGSKFSTKKTKPIITVVLNPPLPNTKPLQAREPIYQNLTVSYSPDQGCVTDIDQSSSTERKAPPRPASAVKAESPVLHGPLQGIKSNQNPSAQRHSLPSPPSVLPVGNSTIQETSKPKQSTVTDLDTNKANPSPKPYVNLDYDNKRVSQQIDSCAADSREIGSGVRAPIPVPRKTKPPTSNGVPKPAPRPARPNEVPGQFQQRELVPGRASRTSKKNPHFRTLPLNDRGSLKRPEKPKSGQNDEDNNANMTPTGSSGLKKAPLVPANKPKPDAARKPLLPRNLKPVVEEDTAQGSVAEMKRLLEAKSAK